MSLMAAQRLTHHVFARATNLATTYLHVYTLDFEVKREKELSDGS